MDNKELNRSGLSINKENGKMKRTKTYYASRESKTRFRSRSISDSEEIYSGSADSDPEVMYSGSEGSSSLTSNLLGAFTTFVMMRSDSSSLELSESLRLRAGILENKN